MNLKLNNETITYQVLQAAVNAGVTEFIMCAGSRNVSFVEALRLEDSLTTYYWPEERSAAFFALGRARRTNRAVAVITTSGTAVGELLPATMEAYHLGVPLLLITADRPLKFRGSGAPQTCQQTHIFGNYVKLFQDISKPCNCDLKAWDLDGPAHLNVCLEEPQSQAQFVGQKLALPIPPPTTLRKVDPHQNQLLDRFLNKIKYPLVIVSALKVEAKEAVCAFLLKLNAPVMLEGISNLRENTALNHLKVKATEQILQMAHRFEYPIDGVLRIGGIPTHRIWRDLEYKGDSIDVLGISEIPFSGLSTSNDVIMGEIGRFFSHYALSKSYSSTPYTRWIQEDAKCYSELTFLFRNFPRAESSILHTLSNEIATNSHVYLGNSLPIREWDTAATHEHKNFDMKASRGLNGIDGQISTFLGFSSEHIDNWAILGDLTTLYDLVGLWIRPQLTKRSLNIAIINNGGAQLFAKLHPYQEMLNSHQLSFEPLAAMWNASYHKIRDIDAFNNLKLPHNGLNILEILPDKVESDRLNKEISSIYNRTQTAYA